MDRKDFDLDYNDLDVGSSKPKTIVKKKGGFLGKLVAFLLGMIIGAIGLVGGVIGGAYLVLTRVKINDAVNKVEGLAGIEIPLDKYLSDVYANQTVLDFVKEVAKVAADTANGNGTLGDFNAISPAVGRVITGEGGLLELLANYGLKLNANEVMNKYLVKGDNASGEETDYLFGYIMSEVKNMPLDSILKVAGMEGNALIDILVYGIEDEDYTRDEQGNIVMNEGKEVLTIGGAGGADLTNRILKAPAGSFMKSMGFEGNDLLDTLIYGIEEEDYTVVGDKKVMNPGKKQLTLEELLGSGFETRLDKLPIDALLDVKTDDSMMLAVAYGSANRYTIDGDTVVMNPIEYTFKDGAVYDDKDVELKVTVEKADVSEFTYLLTFGDESKQYMKLENGKYIAYAYEEHTDAYKPVLYPKNTVGDLQKEDGLSSLVDAVTLADILNIEKNDNDMMSSIAFDADGNARTIGDLRENQAEIIDSITLADALGIDESEEGMIHSIAFDKDGNARTLGDFKDGKSKEIFNSITIEDALDVSSDSHAVIQAIAFDKDGNARTLADFEGSKSNAIINSVTLADALGIHQEDDDMMSAIAFDKDGTPRTIGDFSDSDKRNSIIHDIELTSVIKTDINEADAVVKYMLYGKEGVHYEIGADGQIVYLLKRVALFYDEVGRVYKVYNEYGEQIEDATANDTASYTHQGKTYTLIADDTLGTMETTDGNEATLYYVENEYYQPHTIGDMQDGDLLTNMNHHLTLGDMMDVSNNDILHTLGDVSIDDLPGAINDLTIEDVFGKHFLYRTMDENGNIQSYHIKEIDGEEVFVDDSDGNEKVISGLTLIDVNNKPLTMDEKDEALTGTWKYLLRDIETGKIHHDYTLVKLDNATSNLTQNVQGSPLYELKLDGIVNDISYETLDKPLITEYPSTEETIQINGVDVTALNRFDSRTAEEIAAGDPDVATIGDLTVPELMSYMSIVLDLIP